MKEHNLVWSNNKAIFNVIKYNTMYETKSKHIECYIWWWLHYLLPFPNEKQNFFYIVWQSGPNSSDQ